MPISRRDFIGTAALGAVAAPLVSATGMPMRTLGSTGTQVSILAFGGGSRFVGYPEEKGLEVLNHALDLGITYVDTADSYGSNGESQIRVGKVLKARGRKGLWLASKIGPRKYDDFMRMLDISLKRLQVDYVDLLHVHALMGPDDLEAVSAKDGAYAAAVKAKLEKKARFIGITCHAYPDVLKTALERHDFDCTQMALNAAMRSQVKGAAPSFETTALPVALAQENGRHRDEDLRAGCAGRAGAPGEAHPVLHVPAGCRRCDRYAQAGARRTERPGRQSLSSRCRLTEMKRISGELSAKNSMALHHFFQNHVDA